MDDCIITNGELHGYCGVCKLKHIIHALYIKCSVVYVNEVFRLHHIHDNLNMIVSHWSSCSNLIGY